jgi:hypothetical protein
MLFPNIYSGIDGADKGIIPLTCLELFDRVDAKKAADSHVSFTVEVSYIEVRRLVYSRSSLS